MGKGEVSWKGRTEEGVSRQVYAHRVGGEWRMTHHQASPIAALVEELTSQPPSNRLN